MINFLTHKQRLINSISVLGGLILVAALPPNTLVAQPTTNVAIVMGVINRAQQAHRLEKGTFATQIQFLDTEVDQTDYIYKIIKANRRRAVIKAIPKASHSRSYASGALQEEGEIFKQITCETDKPSQVISSPYLKHNNWNCGAGSHSIFQDP